MRSEPILPQTAPWYDRLTTVQEGYYLPWRASLPPLHGEDVYRLMVEQHLSPDLDVLEAACGHGADALWIAPRCRSLVAYDRTAPWIELAQRNASEHGIQNATFICHDSSLEANGGQARLPGSDASYDLLLCSKGPFHWIEGARRVARPGATLLMLVPDAVPLTEWHALVPSSLQWQEADDPAWARPSIERRLATVDLRLDTWLSFDVPERFPDAEQLYVWLSWGRNADEIVSFEDAAPALERIFDRYADADGLEVRYRRYVWKACVPR